MDRLELLNDNAVKKLERVEDTGFLIRGTNGKELFVTDAILDQMIKERAEQVKADASLVPGTKYTQEQLEAAFNKVKPDSHWKNPISKVIPMPTEEELDCIREAVIHFTGSIITTQNRGDHMHIYAPGYYRTIGA